MKIAIAGTGYVGLVSAVCFASYGHSVVCVDVDEQKIDMLRAGKTPIYEPGLVELMLRHAANLSYTTDFMSAYQQAEVIFICVGTPEKSDGSANLHSLLTVADQISRAVERDVVVVIKSTVPIGTNDEVEKRIRKAVQNTLRVHIISNPEFLSQGTAIRDTLQASRVVVGVEDPSLEVVMREVYSGYKGHIIITSRRSAEMIKYASNDFLALKISYLNEIANLCEIVGADIEDVSMGMGYDSRIGKSFLKAGIGYGGSCFPKDTKALHWLANYHDYEIKTIKAAIEINENQKLVLIKKSRKYYEDFSNKKIAILGITFKPETDDLREAPALANIPIFLEDNAFISVYDPIGEKNYEELFPKTVHFCHSIEDTLLDADICFIFTEWEEITRVNLDIFKMSMKHPIVLDGRNCFKLCDVSGRGFVYESIGRKTIVG